MTGVPAWLGATTGGSNVGQAGQINQFLGSHTAQYLYAGTQTSAQTTAGTGGVTTNGTYLAQSFTTAMGQTAVGYVTANILSTSAPASLIVGLYASSGGAPTGSALVSVTASKEYVAFAPSYITLPLPVTGLTASTTYWIVTQPSGTSGAACFTWNKSNQVSGASTSTNGTTWTAQTYGLLYTVYDQSIITPLTATWEDAGARWTWFNYNTNGTISQFTEYTVSQGTNNYVQSDRNLTYGGSPAIVLTGVA